MFVDLHVNRSKIDSLLQNQIFGLKRLSLKFAIPNAKTVVIPITNRSESGSENGPGQNGNWHEIRQRIRAIKLNVPILKVGAN